MAFVVSIFTIQKDANAQLYINEFLASNDTSFAGPQVDYPDWIEIYNAGATDVMLGGYYMSDVLDVTSAYQIPSTYPDSVTVPAGGFIVFYANKEEASSVFNLNFKLSGSGEQIGLWDSNQVVVDTLTYLTQYTDTSYGRVTDGGATWAFLTPTTPGATNQMAPTNTDLYINEFMASNDSYLAGPQGDFPDWIEIYNGGTTDVMLGGYYMSDVLDVTSAYQIPSTYPDSVTVPAGGYIVFYANKEESSSVFNLNFKLSGSGEQIGLWDPTQAVVDTLTYLEQFADTSYGRIPDGSSTWFLMTTPTPGATNGISSINEANENLTDVGNYPNPFNSITNISFTLEKADQVMVQIFDARGALVQEIPNKNYSRGNHIIKWNASSLPSGYYYYRVQTGSSVYSNKALIIR